MEMGKSYHQINLFELEQEKQLCYCGCKTNRWPNSVKKSTNKTDAFVLREAVIFGIWRLINVGIAQPPSLQTINWFLIGL